LLENNPIPGLDKNRTVGRRNNRGVPTLFVDAYPHDAGGVADHPGGRFSPRRPLGVGVFFQKRVEFGYGRSEVSDDYAALIIWQSSLRKHWVRFDLSDLLP
jgi:hypothetical protein